MWKLYATDTSYFQKNYKKSYIKLKSSFMNEDTALSALSLQVQPVPQRWIWRKKNQTTEKKNKENNPKKKSDLKSPVSTSQNRAKQKLSVLSALSHEGVPKMLLYPDKVCMSLLRL